MMLVLFFAGGDEFLKAQRSIIWYSWSKFCCAVDIVTVFLVCHTDQKPLDLAHGAEMKHILVGHKVCTDGLNLTFLSF